MHVLFPPKCCRTMYYNFHNMMKKTRPKNKNEVIDVLSPEKPDLSSA